MLSSGRGFERAEFCSDFYTLPCSSRASASAQSAPHGWYAECKECKTQSPT